VTQENFWVSSVDDLLLNKIASSSNRPDQINHRQVHGLHGLTVQFSQSVFSIRSQNACHSEFSRRTDDIPPRTAQGPGPKGVVFHDRRLHHEKFHLGEARPSSQRQQSILIFSPPLYQNPSFIQEKAYEPVMLNIPLLGGSAAEGTSHDPESASDAIVAVEDEQPYLEARGTTREESSPLKKIRTIRFAE
jgi:hypothetical protein